VVLNPGWVDRAHFAGLRILEADDPNVLVANDLRLVASAATAARIAPVRSLVLDISEFQKADGGLTCLSLQL
jgi:N-dimethylarginine dimethylaminohydrolase